MAHVIDTQRLPLVGLIAPSRAISAGASREGLHSLFRRLCEKNQLPVSDVFAELILPFLDTNPNRFRKMPWPVQFVDRGGSVSSKLIERIEILSNLRDLSSTTLRELIEIRGVGTLPVSRRRKWCSDCFEYDLTNRDDPFDRLLWSIRDVQVCPIHRSILQTVCPNCGASELSILSGRDVSGRCQKCLGWLGGQGITLDESRDDHSRFLMWTAKSYSDLLDSPLPPKFDVGPNVRKWLLALTDQYFSGVQAQLAKAIERTQSAVSTWLAGRSAPRWDALCELSYVFQIPLADILTGQMDALAMSTIRKLPIGAAKRLMNPRKLPEHRDLLQIKAFFLQVENGEFPGITSMKDVGKRLNIHVRGFSRILPAETAHLVAVLRDRREYKRQVKKASRERAIMEQIERIIGNQKNSGRKTTRRYIDSELALAGLSVRRHESQLINRFVQLSSKNLNDQQNSGNL